MDGFLLSIKIKLGQFSSIVSNEKQRQALKVAKSSYHKRYFVSEFADYLEVIMIGLQAVKK